MMLGTPASSSIAVAIGRFKRAALSHPSFATYGPRSDGEYEAFLAAHGGVPL